MPKVVDTPNIRIIWIVPKFPLGSPDGARHATCSLLRHLAQLDVAIDLICLLPRGEPAEEVAARKQLGVSSCSRIARSHSKLWPLPNFWTPFTFKTFATSAVRRAFRNELARLLDTTRPAQHTFMVFDGLHTFGALSHRDLQNFSGKCRGVIYRAHNFETALWEQYAWNLRRPWTRWLFRYQAWLVKNFERRIAQSVHLVAPVSEEDANKFENLSPGVVQSVTPIGIDFPHGTNVTPVRDRGKFDLLFIGRLDWFPNRAGLFWFLETIWPPLIARRPNTSLKIIGSGDGHWLQKFRDLPGVEFLGKVDDVEPFYRSCVLSIVPIFHGSGTRVKILEAGRYARAVVASALGAEGTGLVPGVSYYRAERAEEWLSLLETLTFDGCRMMGMRAFQEVRRRFDGQSIAQQFVHILESLHTNPSLSGKCASPVQVPSQGFRVQNPLKIGVQVHK